MMIIIIIMIIIVTIVIKIIVTLTTNCILCYIHVVYDEAFIWLLQEAMKLDIYKLYICNIYVMYVNIVLHIEKHSYLMWHLVLEPSGFLVPAF